jgi:glyoxylase-like metal-dependent hydrolase (beta-lactamase superfamily II)
MAAAPNLTKITRLGIVNAFLVAEEDGLTLVDTTLSGGAKAIMGAGQALGLPIVRIALTHAHGDHVGQLDALADGLPGIEIAISERDAPLLEKDKTPRPGEPGDAKYRGSYPGTKTRPTRLLSAGDRVGSLEVLAAPGHTPGHVAFLDTRDRTLIAGDAYSTLAGVTTSASMNPRFPLPYLSTWHRPTALQSARELRALDSPRLAVGHGRILDDPGAAMDRAIARAG